jgi:hypothetical protein
MVAMGTDRTTGTALRMSVEPISLPFKLHYQCAQGLARNLFVGAKVVSVAILKTCLVIGAVGVAARHSCKDDHSPTQQPKEAHENPKLKNAV